MTMSSSDADQKTSTMTMTTDQPLVQNWLRICAQKEGCNSNAKTFLKRT